MTLQGLIEHSACVLGQERPHELSYLHQHAAYMRVIAGITKSACCDK